MISSRPTVSTHTQYPSRFAIGDVVHFMPDALSGMMLGGMRISCTVFDAKIVGVTFITGKVFYDLALPDADSFYEANPIRNVDSIFVAAKP